MNEKQGKLGHYQRVAFNTLCFLLIILQSSCAVFGPSRRIKFCKEDTLLNDSILCLEADSSSEKQIEWNESWERIIHTVDTCYFYKMEGLIAKDTIPHDSLYHYAIEQNLGILSSESLSILKFLIEDKSLYESNYSSIRHPFHPNITLKFQNESDTLLYMASFGSDEIAIVDSLDCFHFFIFKDMKLLKKWRDKIVQEMIHSN